MPKSPEDLDRIVEECILKEIQAMTLYTTLANRVRDERTSGILRYLSEMEESHVGRLVEIFSRTTERAQKAFAGVDVIKAFQSQAWEKHRARLAGAGLTETSPLDDYLTFAIVAEVHARTYYERLSGESEDPRVKEIFRILALEEAGHEQQLQEIQKGLRKNG